MHGTTSDTVSGNANPGLAARSPERVVMRLDHEPQTMWTADERPMMAFTGRVDGVAIPLTVFLPLDRDDAIAPALERSLRDVGGGDTVTLTGRWQYQDWPDGSGKAVPALSFFAGEFEKGDVPKPGMRTLDRFPVPARANRAPDVHGGFGFDERRAHVSILTRMDADALIVLATSDIEAQLRNPLDDRARARVDLAWNEFERRQQVHLFQRASNDAAATLGIEVSRRDLAAATSEKAFRASLSPQFQSLMRDRWAKGL